MPRYRYFCDLRDDRRSLRKEHRTMVDPRRGDEADRALRAMAEAAGVDPEGLTLRISKEDGRGRRTFVTEVTA